MGTSDKHFKYIFWYVVGLSVVTFAYVYCITFATIPKENVRFADTALGFLLGSALSAGIGYLLVGTPDKKKDDPKTVQP